MDEKNTEDSDENIHPVNIQATRPDYYTIPTLDVLAEIRDEIGNCYVRDFVIGRENYGKLTFSGTTNVANLNIDRDVLFK